MICDNCTKKDKCTKIISESEIYCLDKTIPITTYKTNYKTWAESVPKDFLSLVDPYNSDMLQGLSSAIDLLINNRR